MAETVAAEDFAAILAQVRQFVRDEVVPREREIADTNAIPDDLRQQAAAMGLFGYAIPQEYGGSAWRSPRTWSLRWSSATRRWRSARCSAPTTGSPGRCSSADRA